jgi:hypothetical protein
MMQILFKGCVRHWAMILLGGGSCILLTSCITPSPVAANQWFSRFPARFEAVQTLEIDAGGKSEQLLAQLSRNGDEFEVLFLDPIWQQPLLRLKTAAEAELTTEWIKPDISLPFDPRMILASIRELYAAEHFASDELAADSYQLLGQHARYRLSEVAGSQHCPYPRRIAVQFPATTDGLQFSLRIVNQEFECPG